MLILYTENDIIYKLHLLSFKKGRSHMKNAKKYLSLLLSFLLTFCCISLPANAEVYYNSLSDTPDIADTYDMPKTHNDDTTPIITKGKGGGNQVQAGREGSSCCMEDCRHHPGRCLCMVSVRCLAVVCGSFHRLCADHNSSS